MSVLSPLGRSLARAFATPMVVAVVAPLEVLAVLRAIVPIVSIGLVPLCVLVVLLTLMALLLGALLKHYEYDHPETKNTMKNQSSPPKTKKHNDKPIFSSQKPNNTMTNQYVPFKNQKRQ